MRRRAGLVLLAFAVFFAALSPLLRWYAFPRLAKVPPNQYQEVVLEASPATLLDYTALKARKVEKVTIVQTPKGNVEESEKIERSAGRDVVVWDALSCIQGPDGKTVSEIPERYIFDAHTQAPVNATGEMVDGDPVRREGIEFKWPFLTEKRDTRTSTPRAAPPPPSTTGAPAPSAAWRSTTSSRPSRGPRSRCRRRCPSRASPPNRSHRPA